MFFMKLAIFNGSPRRKKSNSTILSQYFISGYSKQSGEIPELFYLADIQQLANNLDHYKNAEIVIFIFPLYTDCMPAVVKRFFEEIHELGKEQQSKKFGFIVQSGFPEIIHSVWLERYLEKFVKRIGGEYLGTVIKGGVEGIQIMPKIMTRKLFNRFEKLGEYFAIHEEFEPKIVAKMRKPFKLSLPRRMLFKMFNFFGFTNVYWNMNLKKNNAYENRFDQPYKFINKTN